MADPWNASAGDVASIAHAGGVLTLVEGSTFCISSSSGDIAAGTPHGLFFLDTRFLSCLELRVNGSPPEALAATSEEPFAGTFVLRARPRPGQADSTLMVFRRRYIGYGMREDLAVHNFGEEAAYCHLELRLDTDFGDLFEVKAGRSGQVDERTVVTTSE
ncbi:MAG: glycogen debranching N-terminal domain-containing protein, partial [Actinomycetota bacterium]